MDRKRFAGFALQRTEAPRTPPLPQPLLYYYPFLKEKGVGLLGGGGGGSLGYYGAFMVPSCVVWPKAEAASKSLMQNLCSCGCFSGWKNQYCGSDAWRWLSALWLTVKAKRDWGATFNVLEMERGRVCLIVEFTFNFNFIVAYFGGGGGGRFRDITPSEVRRKKLGWYRNH